VHDQDELLYRGGFLVVAVLAGVLVVAAAHPDVALGKALGFAPLRYLGERSYAIYLWHWPIFAVTQPGINTTLSPLASTVIRIGGTLLVPGLSYRLVEKPLRGGAPGPARKAGRPPGAAPPAPRPPHGSR